MVSPERVTKTVQELRDKTMESPRISFSAELMNDEDEEDSFISISPRSSFDEDEIAKEVARVKNIATHHEFEFLSSKNSFDGTGNHTMLTADELFSAGKLLTYRQINHAADKLSKIKLNSTNKNDINKDANVKLNVNLDVIFGRDQQEPRIWFVDDDSSPRPPKCTVLWKELFKLKKKKASSTLSPSPSSSSSSSSSPSSLRDSSSAIGREKDTKRTRKVSERARSASSSIRIRPMVNVPIFNQGNSTSLPPLFPMWKAKA